MEQRLLSKRLCVFIICTHFSDKEKQLAMIRDNIPAGIRDNCQLYFLTGSLSVEKLTPDDAAHLSLESSSAARRAKLDQPEYPTTIHEESIMPLVQHVRSFHTALPNRADRLQSTA